MKKILSIIILGLLLGGNAYANITVTFEMQKKFIKDGTIKKGMHYGEINEIIALKWYGGVNDQIFFSKSKIDAYCGIAHNDNIAESIGYCFDKKSRLIETWEDPILMIEHWLKKVTHKKDKKKLNKLKTQILSAKSTNTTESKTASSNSSSNLSTNDKIAQSKQICRDLGFKTNTEKFADCALKMMSIQFEATNKVASSGGTTQEIIVKHKQDYDVWDALLDVSNVLLSDGNNSSSSSSNSNSNTRCVIGKTNPMFGTTTMNCR